MYDVFVQTWINRLERIEVARDTPPDLRRIVSDDRQALMVRAAKGDNGRAREKIAEVRAYLATWGVAS